MRGADGAPWRGAVLAGLVAYGVAWAAGLMWQPPLPLYDAALGQWRFGRAAAPQELTWYGSFLMAWGAALVAGACGYVAGRRGLVFGRLWEAWAMTSLGLALVLSLTAFWP